jgi:hypothetical protein
VGGELMGYIYGDFIVIEFFFPLGGGAPRDGFPSSGMRL